MLLVFARLTPACFPQTVAPEMKRDGFLFRALLLFGVAVLLYAITYTAIERRRAAKGPWEVTFTQEAAGAPAILINQPALGITNVQITFSESSATDTDGRKPPEVTTPDEPETLTFRQPRKTPFEVPFGKCVFLDTVFLPGTVALELFGHQIQLMPRVLTIDGAEQPWRSNEQIKLNPRTAKDSGAK